MSELSFHEFGLSENTLKSLEKKGFKEPTPIQKLSIPWAIKGFDLLAQAQTGTGKTAAFALPSLSRLDANLQGIQILVLAPTRELAQQVATEIQELGFFDKVQVATVVGGKSYAIQRKQIKTAKILVATPGRLNDLLNSGEGLTNFKPQIVILDEADRMLDMGFTEDLEAILSHCPVERQTLMFSATFPKSIMQLSNKYQKQNRKFIQAESATETNENIAQKFVVVPQHLKEEALFRWIDYEQPQKSILFCEMKKDADHLGTVLMQRGYRVSILHGDTEQNRREQIMRSFRSESAGFLVATDIAARGLDVYDITHVINFQFPRHIDSYVHRIGRTGRAGKKGTALSMILPREVRQLERVERHTKAKVEKVRIPKLTQLRDKAIDSLLSRVEAMPLDPKLESHLLQKWIEKDMDQDSHQTLTLKLIQSLLGDRFFSGPETIEVAPTSQRSTSYSGGGGGSSSRRGGGGGYRRDEGGRGDYRGGRSSGGGGGRSGSSGGGYRSGGRSNGPAATGSGGEGSRPSRSGEGGGSPRRGGGSFSRKNNFD